MIRYTAFCKIVELGSFTRAAEVLGYTQAAISQMVRSLEAELKLTLLTRTRSGVKLTQEGTMMYPFIQKTVACQRAMADKAREIYDLGAGEIRIGTFSSISQHWLPLLIKKFKDQYPNILFRLYQGDYTTMGDWLRSGYIDFCFADLAAIPGFSTITLAKDSFLAVLPVDHPLSRHSLAPLSTLASEPLIAAEEGNISTVLAAFESVGKKPRIEYAVHDDYTILAMVEQGLGYSILPAMVLDRTNYAFSAIPTTPTIIRQIGVAYRDIELMPVATRQFMKFMNESLDDLVKGHYIPAK